MTTVRRFRQALALFALLAIAAPSAFSAPAFAAPRPPGYPNASHFGSVPDRHTFWYRQCMRVEPRQPHSSDLQRGHSDCQAGDASASDLYYDKLNQASTSQREWDQVRYCAVASNDTAVLMMLHANGLGVPRDVDLAIRFACSGAAAPAEMEGRVEHLVTLQDDPRRFDQCDDITSGAMGGVCAAIGQRQAGKVRTAFLARLRAGLTAPQQAPFDALVKASGGFADVRGSNEVDMTGTARIQMAIDAEGRELEWLREHLAAFEKGLFTLPAPGRFSLADAELNRAYARVMGVAETAPGHPGQLPHSSVDKAGVRTAQRAWLAYRDAWVRFAALRYPALDPASLKAALTQWRHKQLAALAPE